MTDARRCVGRYLLGTEIEGDLEVRRYLEVRLDEDALVAVTEETQVPFVRGFVSRDDPRIERRRGAPLRLDPCSDELFAVAGLAERFRFVQRGGGDASAVVVIRDGAPSRPCPRVVPPPREIAGRRELGSPLDLGHPQLCMPARDTAALRTFYARLGFVFDPRVSANPDPETSGVVCQGRSVLAFCDWIPQPCINFRGPSIVETAFELARRGYEVAPTWSGARSVPSNSVGSFMVYDPDGHRMFFNTHPRERSIYEAWKAGALEPGVGRHHEWNPEDVREELPFGQLVVCLDVTDLRASVAFYRGMGFEIVDASPESVILFSAPARENRYAFPIRVRRAAAPRYSFGFLCRDVPDLVAKILERHVPIVDTPGGPAFADPDGNPVVLLPERG